MAKCCDSCEPLCDFCIHYKDDDERYPRLCAGEGICKIDGHNTLIYEDCEDFHCFKAERS